MNLKGVSENEIKLVENIFKIFIKNPDFEIKLFIEFLSNRNEIFNLITLIDKCFIAYEVICDISEYNFSIGIFEKISSFFSSFSSFSLFSSFSFLLLFLFLLDDVIKPKEIKYSFIKFIN